MADPCLLDSASQVSWAACKSSSPGLPLDAGKERVATTACLTPPASQLHSFGTDSLRTLQGLHEYHTWLGPREAAHTLFSHSGLSGVHLICPSCAPQPILPARLHTLGTHHRPWPASGYTQFSLCCPPRGLLKRPPELVPFLLRPLRVVDSAKSLIIYSPVLCELLIGFFPPY